MGDQIPMKDRRLNAVNQKERIITPDVMLHTKNVMIPIVKPMPFKQSFNIRFSENRPQILKAQNYRNNPALLFLETPSRTLYNPLESLFKKSKNQSTKYTISGKTDSSSIKKTDSQNSCLLKRLFCKEKDEALHFPNTTLKQFMPLINDDDLHKISSKSIKLSRKCDLSQMKKNQIKCEKKFVVLPKMETPISIVTNKLSVISLPNQSFYDITNVVSPVSTVSMSNFKIENKKTFANIVDRRKSLSIIASNHLHPSNSEHEINVLHYENDILSENNYPHFAQSHLKSTNWSSTDNSILAIIQNNNENLANKKNAIESHHRWDTEKAICDIKYSWKDNWILSSQKKGHDNAYGIKNVEKNGRKPYDCKIKYSWQVIGTGTQTSYSLLQDLLDNTNTEDNKPVYKMCSIKYSWQIIGISTQASLHDCNDPDYWSGVLLIPNKNYNENNDQVGNNETDYTKLQDHAKYLKGNLKKYLILNNQQTQTFAEKEIQVDANDYYAKYSWHNLIKQYL